MSTSAPAMSDNNTPPWTILCVDDEQNIPSALRRMFRVHGYRVLTASSGAEGLTILQGNERVDLVVSDMKMPEMDGTAFLERVRDGWPDTIRLLLTGYADVESTIGAINRGEIYRYISKPWNDNDVLLMVQNAFERKILEREKKRLEALTQRQNEQLRELNATLEARVEERTAQLKQAFDSLTVANERLKASFLSSIKLFSNLIELREGSASGHSRRVADLGRRLAVKLGLSPREVQDVFIAGLLHDIGKIGLPEALLATPVSQLDGESLGAYRKHPSRGAQALIALEELRDTAVIVRSHRERFDGLGFPDSLAGLAIPLGARIIAIAKDYDSAQTGDLLQRRLNRDEAKAYIVQGRGKRYDPRVVDAFLGLIDGTETVPRGERTVVAAELQPGMVLSRDLVTRDGVLLLAADHILDPALVDQIREFEVTEGKLLPIFVRNEWRK